MNFYNEFDPNAAAWLRELIARKLIPNGVVDERSIADIQPHEITSYTQCHFFAGIGGWPLALQLDNVDPTRPLWTMSCPCQPFSGAGKGLGEKDPRHLWPVAFNLIRECGPQHVFGEQVASAIGHGWLDGISADLESEGYACGAAVLGAHSVGAPHIRQRLYWVADSQSQRRNGSAEMQGKNGRSKPETNGSTCGLDNPAVSRFVTTGERPELREERGRECVSGDGCELGRVGNTALQQCGGAWEHETSDGRTSQDRGSNPWSDSSWHPCRDGKHRRIPTQPALSPLADGVPYKLARRGSIRPALLKGAGNAIVPEVAAEFIQAFFQP